MKFDWRKRYEPIHWVDKCVGMENVCTRVCLQMELPVIAKQPVCYSESKNFGEEYDSSTVNYYVKNRGSRDINVLPSGRAGKRFCALAGCHQTSLPDHHNGIITEIQSEKKNVANRFADQETTGKNECEASI